jgi:hypothetical protein
MVIAVNERPLHGIELPWGKKLAMSVKALMHMLQNAIHQAGVTQITRYGIVKDDALPSVNADENDRYGISAKGWSFVFQRSEPGLT